MAMSVNLSGEKVTTGFERAISCSAAIDPRTGEELAAPELESGDSAPVCVFFKACALKADRVIRASISSAPPPLRCGRFLLVLQEMTADAEKLSKARLGEIAIPATRRNAHPPLRGKPEWNRSSSRYAIALYEKLGFRTPCAFYGFFNESHGLCRCAK